LPPGRLPITTRWLEEKDRSAAYGEVLRTVGKGHQVYIVCPLVEETEKSDLRSATQMATHLQEKIFPDFRVGLLHGQMKTADKDRIMSEFAAGEIQILVGTHALIQEHVKFPRLGLIIVDEQHRFGVLQRATLMGKGIFPHVLVMTATPIPRTLAMTLYGDLDVSVIDEMPPGRRKVITRVAMEALGKRIGLAARLGCRYVNTGAWTIEKQAFYDTVYEMVDLCRPYNIILGLEVGEPGLTSTGKDLMELLKPVKSENIGINYDTGNIRWLTGIEPETDLPSTLGRLVHMHVKDQAGGRGKEAFPVLGDGEVDFTKVFDVVKNIEFEGPFTIEMEMPAENAARRDNDVKRCKDYLNRRLQ
jgi:sugar phosphate isomerase/epimerase